MAAAAENGEALILTTPSLLLFHLVYISIFLRFSFFLSFLDARCGGVGCCVITRLLRRRPAGRL